jgi:hypothetical protein
MTKTLKNCLSTNNSSAQSTSAHETRIQGAAKGQPKITKKIATVTIRVPYGDREGLCNAVHGLLSGYFVLDSMVSIDLPAEDGGGSYAWNGYLEHLFYDKEYITALELVDRLFSEKRGEALGQGIMGINRLNGFFETLELLLNQEHNGLRLGKQLKLEWQREITIQNYRSESQEMYFDWEMPVLYLRLKLIHPLYADKKKGEALKMQSLQAYLREHPAYIGVVKSTRFEWTEYEENAEPFDGAPAHRVARKMSQLSSAVAMDYSLLKELTGVDFEKNKKEATL